VPSARHQRARREPRVRDEGVVGAEMIAPGRVIRADFEHDQIERTNAARRWS